ncbi:hypothetical protein PAGU1678_13870 [Paraclostridium bifermentans subsp. muricolitidis]|nr:hypothetical protein PAGU1678_13870 [Paraclostridium bifermentans subsp. muricolitidis]
MYVCKIAFLNLISEGNNYTVNIFHTDLYYNRAMYLALIYLIIDGTYVKYKEINV